MDSDLLRAIRIDEARMRRNRERNPYHVFDDPDRLLDEARDRAAKRIPVEITDALVDGVVEMLKALHERALMMGIADSYVVVSRGLLPEMVWRTRFGKVEFFHDPEASPSDIYAMLRQSWDEMQDERLKRNRRA